MFKQIKEKLFSNKEIANAGWIILGRVSQMFLSFFVTVLTTRFLGPSNYGTISYVNSYAAFFSSLCTLGIDSVLVKNIVDNPNEEGNTLGTSILLRLTSSFFSYIAIFIIVFFADGSDKTIMWVCVLSNIQLLFSSFDFINYWFQSRYKSKITAFVTLLTFFVTSGYKIFIIVSKKDIRWFAFTLSFEQIIKAIFLVYTYKVNGGPRLSFSFKKAKQIILSSYQFILSGIMVSIYGQTDKIMLKQMLNETSVGYYSLAFAINNMWVFILVAVIDSIFPTIFRLKKENNEMYIQKNKQLYSIIVYLSAFVAIGLMIFGKLFIKIVYGTQYLPAYKPLLVVCWYTTFSYLGVARGAWVVSENKQKYIKYIHLSAVFINVGMNYLLIPKFQEVGAAIASLTTVISTSIILPFFIPAMRENAKLIFEAIMLKEVFPKKNK